MSVVSLLLNGPRNVNNLQGFETSKILFTLVERPQLHPGKKPFLANLVRTSAKMKAVFISKQIIHEYY